MSISLEQLSAQMRRGEQVPLRHTLQVVLTLSIPSILQQIVVTAVEYIDAAMGISYGLVLMLALLMTGALKLDAVEDAGKFMIEIMPVMFIPAGVGLMASWGTLKPVLVPVSVITVVALVAVMGATGRVSQCVIKKSKAKEKAKEQEI